MADNDKKLEQFISVTGVDEERARFYMESSAWQLEVALGSFYEHDVEESPNVPVDPTESQASAPAPNSTSSILKPKARSKNTNSKFATLQMLSSSSEDEEEGQAFYAGGSEHSGQQILGPPTKKDIVSDMFSAIKRHGVELLDSASSSSSSTFRGTGYKLGQTETDSEAVESTPESMPPDHVTLKLWSDGFSVNDGDLRHYSDPSNREFLSNISRGEIPAELQQGNVEVHLAMEDHRMESFNQRKGASKYKPFSGQGHALGSPAPATIGAPAIQEKDCVVNESCAKKNVSVDTSRPTTNIQIRLADGSRLVGQFNHSHTVGELRAYIITARPQYENVRFALLSCYPPKELNDSDTLADAGLLNAAIMQKLI